MASMSHPLPLVDSVLWDPLMLDVAPSSGCDAAPLSAPRFPLPQPDAPYADDARPMLGKPPSLDSLAESPAHGGSWALHNFLWDAEQLLARAVAGDGLGDIGKNALMPQPLLPTGDAPRRPSANRSGVTQRRRVPEVTRLRCCVAGCTTTVGTRHFNRRSHACDLHVAAHSVDLDGSGACGGLRLVQAHDASGLPAPRPSGSAACRFCQKCYKWHPLSEYDGTKHTCRTQLGKQSAWRRAQSAARAAAAAAGLAVQLAAPRADASGTAGTASTEEARRMSPEEESSTHWLSWLQDEAGKSAPPTELPADDGMLQIKFPDVFPDELPSNARVAIAAAFPSASCWATAGYIEPGCTLLRVEPALPPLPGTKRRDAAAVAAALLCGPAGSWFAHQPWDLCSGGAAVRHAPGATVTSHLSLPAARPGASPPALRALCTAAASSLLLHIPRGWVPRLRFHGAFMGAGLARRRSNVGSGLDDEVTLELPPCPDVEGVALLELIPDCSDAAARLYVAPPPRAVVLTPSRAVAAELASALRGDCSDAAETLLRGIGAAMRPRCPPQLAAAAAADAARCGWPATLARLTEAMRRRVEVDTSAGGGNYSSPGALLAPDGHTSLLHIAARMCCPRCVAVLLPHRGSDEFLFGAPDEADAAGVTPLHIAAALPPSPAARAVVAALLSAGGQRAEHAWEEALDSSGRTPAALAAAAAAAIASSDAAFEAELARASLPHMRIIVALLWLYCVAACVRAYVDAPPEPAAVRAALIVHDGRLDWAALRPLLRGRRYLARLPLVAAATALVAGGPRMNTAYVVRARAVVAVLAFFFLVAEGVASALAARAWLLADGHLLGAPLSVRWGWAADAPPALRVLWPGQLVAAECALSALVAVLPLRRRDALVLLAARAVFLPIATQVLCLPVWHAFADSRWCIAHAAVAVGAAALVQHRASAARAAWDARCREQTLKAA